MEYKIEKAVEGGWEVIAENSNRHSALIMRDAIAPREDTEAFKGIRFRVVNSKYEVQEHGQ